MKKGIVLVLLIFCTGVFAEAPVFLYTLKKDDTLLELCDIFKISREELLEYNREKKINRFWAGETIRIPLKRIKIRKYSIRKGDSLFELIHRYKADLETLYALNNSAILERMWVGDEIRIPVFEEPGEDKEKQQREDFIFYQVRKGDTLFGISRKFNIPLEKIREVYPRNTLFAGDRIKLPKETTRFTLGPPVGINPAPSDFSIPGLHYLLKGNTGIRSPIEGKVIGIRNLKGFGKAIFIKQEDKIAILASKGFQDILVSFGYELKQSQTLATLREGYYLHFFLLEESRFVDPAAFMTN
jgi:LysM repeat protein